MNRRHQPDMHIHTVIRKSLLARAYFLCTLGHMQVSHACIHRCKPKPKNVQFTMTQDKDNHQKPLESSGFLKQIIFGTFAWKPMYTSHQFIASIYLSFNKQFQLYYKLIIRNKQRSKAAKYLTTRESALSKYRFEVLKDKFKCIQCLHDSCIIDVLLYSNKFRRLINAEPK